MSRKHPMTDSDRARIAGSDPDPDHDDGSAPAPPPPSEQPVVDGQAAESRTGEAPAEPAASEEASPAPDVEIPADAPSELAAVDGQAGTQAPTDPHPLKASDAAGDDAVLTPAAQVGDAAAPIRTGAEVDPVTEGFTHAMAAQATLEPARLAAQAWREGATVEQVSEAVVIYIQAVRRAVTVQEVAAALREPVGHVREAVDGCDRLQEVDGSVTLATPEPSSRAEPSPLPSRPPGAPVEDVARITHEVNRAWCEFIGDASQPAWEAAPAWQRESAIAGVRFHQANPNAGDSASHDEWLRHKEADGWKFGPVKDPEAKEHPCMVPFDQLPREQQFKDRLFRTVVHATA